VFSTVIAAPAHNLLSKCNGPPKQRACAGIERGSFVWGLTFLLVLFFWSKQKKRTLQMNSFILKKTEIKLRDCYFRPLPP
jgi:hypothetical protein